MRHIDTLILECTQFKTLNCGAQEIRTYLKAWFVLFSISKLYMFYAGQYKSYFWSDICFCSHLTNAEDSHLFNIL